VSTADSIASFGHVKYDVRKMVRQFDADIDSTIIPMRNKDMAVFCLSQLKMDEKPGQ
jgi:hypothetical protein